MSASSDQLRQTARRIAAYEAGDIPFASNMPAEALDRAAAEIERYEAALEESELSHIICGALNCDCPGDEHGAHSETAKCHKVAAAIRAALGTDQQKAGEK